MLEPRVTDKPPAGAGPESVSCKFCDAPLGKASVAGLSENDAVTAIDWLAAEKPVAKALIVAEPGLTPVTVGCTAGVANPAAINTEFTERAARALLLNRLTVTPPDGATADRLTCKLIDWPSATLALAGI